MYVYRQHTLVLISLASQCFRTDTWTHVDLSILEALLEILIDGLVGDLAEERHIADTSLRLLEPFPPISLHDTTRRICTALAALLWRRNGSRSATALLACLLGDGHIRVV